MATRGFVAIWYAGYGFDRPIPNPETARFWRRMVAGVLRSWRVHHPSEELVFLDLDSQFTEGEHGQLKALGIQDGRSWYPGPSDPMWTRTWLDKAHVLRLSPFAEACLFDLDILFLGNISGAFELVGQVGAIGYEHYRQTRNRVNTGIFLVKDRGIWPAYWAAAADLRGRDRWNDERALDLAIDRGSFRVTKLSASYCQDAFCWRMAHGETRRGRGWSDVTSLVPPVRTVEEPWSGPWMLNPWHMGASVVRSIHMSGHKGQIVGSDLWRAYQSALVTRLEEKWGGSFRLSDGIDP